jgi:hypothetical protein
MTLPVPGSLPFTAEGERELLGFAYIIDSNQEDVSRSLAELQRGIEHPGHPTANLKEGSHDWSDGEDDLKIADQGANARDLLRAADR